MNFKLLNSNVQEILFEFGWCKERNLKSYLVFTQQKNIFANFMTIAKSFVGLEISYIDYRHNECALHFDLDESIVSKNIRARYYNYESHLDINWLKDVDYRETENFHICSVVEQKIGKKCARIGYWDAQDIGLDLYVSVDGQIFSVNYDDPTLVSQSFVEFLNDELYRNKKLI